MATVHKEYCMAKVKWVSVEKKLLERGSNKWFPVGPNGKYQKLRGFALSENKVQEVLDRWNGSGVFCSPYSRGIRSDHLNALVALGVNQAWSIADILPKLREIMTARQVKRSKDKTISNAWEVFTEKDHDDKRLSKIRRPQPVLQRIYDNYVSFRRLGYGENKGWSPYGRKLEQIGCCIDIFLIRQRHGTSTIVQKFIRLNTHSDTPLSMSLSDPSKIPPVDARKPTMGPRK